MAKQRRRGCDRRQPYFPWDFKLEDPFADFCGLDFWHYVEDGDHDAQAEGDLWVAHQFFSELNSEEICDQCYTENILLLWKRKRSPYYRACLMIGGTTVVEVRERGKRGVSFDEEACERVVAKCLVSYARGMRDIFHAAEKVAFNSLLGEELSARSAKAD